MSFVESRVTAGSEALGTANSVIWEPVGVSASGMVLTVFPRPWPARSISLVAEQLHVLVLVPVAAPVSVSAAVALFLLLLLLVGGRRLGRLGKRPGAQVEKPLQVALVSRGAGAVLEQ